MKLNEAEMRMAFQVESTDRIAILNELRMMGRYAPNQEIKDTAESLLAKLCTLSERECMDLIRKVQTEYRLPGKARTIGEMLAEARQQFGAQKLSGHDIMALERFDPDTRHMIVFDVLSDESPMGWKGEKMRLFLTETGYGKALENQEKGFIKIRNHAKVLSGNPIFPQSPRGSDGMGRDRMQERERYRELILENIEYDFLTQNHRFDRDRLDELVELMVDTVCSRREMIHIAGDDYPAEVVKSRFLKLDSSHIEYVLERMAENTTYVRNIKKYLLAALYNAPATIGSYYTSLVSHDMYGGGDRR